MHHSMQLVLYYTVISESSNCICSTGCNCWHKPNFLTQFQASDLALAFLIQTSIFMFWKCSNCSCTTYLISLFWRQHSVKLIGFPKVVTFMLVVGNQWWGAKWQMKRLHCVPRRHGANRMRSSGPQPIQCWWWWRPSLDYIWISF